MYTEADAKKAADECGNFVAEGHKLIDKLFQNA